MYYVVGLLAVLVLFLYWQVRSLDRRATRLDMSLKDTTEALNRTKYMIDFVDDEAKKLNHRMGKVEESIVNIESGSDATRMYNEG